MMQDIAQYMAWCCRDLDQIGYGSAVVGSLVHLNLPGFTAYT